MKKLILPILCAVLILRPMFLGGTLWSDYSDATNVLPIVSQAIAADKPSQNAVPEPQTMQVWVTAYSSVPEETDESPFITATNKTVQDGFIAANFLPFGTKVRIPELFGDKVFTVEDRMSRRKIDFMDVWMPTKADALAFGIHRAEVVVVEMGMIPNPMPSPTLVKNVVDKNPAID